MALASSVCIFCRNAAISGKGYGDNLQIGPYSFEIALGQGSPTDSLATPMSPEKLKRVQDALDSSVGMKAKLFRHRSAFSGQLQEIGLMSLLQTIGANKRTGSLSIQFESEKGAVYLEKGELVHATLGRAFGPKAFYRMVKFEKGSFENNSSLPGASPTIEPSKAASNHICWKPLATSMSSPPIVTSFPTTRRDSYLRQK